MKVYKDLYDYWEEKGIKYESVSYRLSNKKIVKLQWEDGKKIWYIDVVDWIKYLTSLL
jgi:hypothetical protein